MQINAFLGNKQAVNAIQTAMQKGQLSHALLIAAPDGCGRGFLARCIAADYLYPAGGAGAAAVMQQQSPELIVIEGEGRSGNIPVARVREVRSQIHHTSLSATGRAVWIKDAHNMAAPASNALLKVLEEPPPNVLFILTTRNASALPLTLQSRCVLYSLHALPVAVCRQQLLDQLPEEQDPHWADVLSVLYNGRLGAGLKTLHSEEKMQTVQDALALVQAVQQHDEYTVLKILSAYEGRADDDRAHRQTLLNHLTDALEASLLGTGGDLIPAVSHAKAAACLPAVGQAQAALQANAAPHITFTSLAIKLSR